MVITFVYDMCKLSILSHMKRLPFYGLALMYMTTVKDGGFPFWIKKEKPCQENLDRAPPEEGLKGERKRSI